MTECCMRDYHRLHRRGVVLHQVGDAGVGIDDYLVGQVGVTPAIAALMLQKVLAIRPMPIGKRHPMRGIDVEHLLRRDHLDAVGVHLQPELVTGDALDRAVAALQNAEIPISAIEEQG